MPTAYLDHNATTPVDEQVLQAMLPYFSSQYGNASSRHTHGRAARQAIEEAREQVAALVHAHPSQVVFLSGGTEANNLAIKGMAAVLNPAQVAVSAIEHPCVMKSAQELQLRGWAVRRLPVDGDGKVPLSAVEQCLHESTAMVSVMLANNETGVVQDVVHIAQLARSQGALMHTDAVQAVGKIPVDFTRLNVHALSFSAHKIYGPKGAAALVMDKQVELAPQMVGGGHEKGLRAGTENVPAIVGFGKACELAAQRLEALGLHMRNLQCQVETGLKHLGGVLFGEHAIRLPNTSFFAFPHIDGETLVVALDRAGFALASGSACSSASTEASATLLAMGVEAQLAKGAIRISLGKDNTPRQVEDFLKHLSVEVQRLGKMAALAV